MKYYAIIAIAVLALVGAIHETPSMPPTVLVSPPSTAMPEQTPVAASTLPVMAQTKPVVVSPSTDPTPVPSPIGIPEPLGEISDYDPTLYQSQDAHYQWDAILGCFNDSNYAGIFHEVIGNNPQDWLSSMPMNDGCTFYFHPEMGKGNVPN